MAYQGGESVGGRPINRLLEVRSQLYELLVHCIPPTVVLKVRRRGSSPCYSGRLCEPTNAPTGCLRRRRR